GTITEEGLLVYKAGNGLIYVKRKKAISLGNVTSRVALVPRGGKFHQLEKEIQVPYHWLPKKWISFCQSLRNTNHVKDSELASLFGKLKYEENLIVSIYETEKSKSLVSTTPLSTAFLTTSIVQDFQDRYHLMVGRGTRAVLMNDLEEEYQARALLAKSKRFFKKGTQRFSSTKATDQTECHKCGKKGYFVRDCWSKTSVPSYQSPFQPKLLHSSEHKPEPMHTKDFEAKYNKVKAKLALLSSSASAPRSSSGKNKSLIAETYDWVGEEVSSDDNEVTEVKALMALTDEERVSVGKESANNGEWVKISIQKHVNTKILKENQNLRLELKELTSITETWLNSSNKVNQCINEQIPTQKKKIMGIDQLTEDTSSFGSKDPIFVKSLADNPDMSITSSNIPKSSKTEDSTLPNHDTGESKSTFKAETLKGITINEPSLAPARGKSSSASKTNSAPASKLKNVKIEDDPPLAIVMKELVGN
ncbi:retrovirus-related pol polyprotein from transposon TNT 1-94, partial [Tanacetum coccineum]